MLIFLCPLQSRAVSKNWRQVTDLCRQSVASMCRQTSDQFKVFLICNEDPGIEVKSPHLEILTHDFPIPGPSFPERAEDKHSKLNFGAYAARSLAPAYFMKADADDRVSNRLAHFVYETPSAYGWYFKYGYIHEPDSKWLHIKTDFHMLCGTSAILRCGKEDLPSSPELALSRPSPIHFGHHLVQDQMAALGRPLDVLPFPGAIYETGTGQNNYWTPVPKWSGLKKLVEPIKTIRRLDSRKAREFGYQLREEHQR